MKKTLLEISKICTPLVVQSCRHIQHGGKIYKRRLRISGMTALLLDESLGTNMYRSKSEFFLLDVKDVKMACEVLQIDFRGCHTYIKIDQKMCSYSSGPWDKK